MVELLTLNILAMLFQEIPVVIAAKTSSSQLYFFLLPALAAYCAVYLPPTYSVITLTIQSMFIALLAGVAISMPLVLFLVLWLVGTFAAGYIPREVARGVFFGMAWLFSAIVRTAFVLSQGNLTLVGFLDFVSSTVIFTISDAILGGFLLIAIDSVRGYFSRSASRVS